MDIFFKMGDRMGDKSKLLFGVYSCLNILHAENK